MLETCQRDIYGDIIAGTCSILVASIVIDSSGTMGSYLPETVEDALNAFFRYIEASDDADALTRLCIYESYDETRVLGGFEAASNFQLKDLRSGGGWNLPFALAQALESLNNYTLLLQRQGCATLRPMVLVVSDNIGDEDAPSFQILEQTIRRWSLVPGIAQPRILHICDAAESVLSRHVPELEIRRSNVSALPDTMRSIARNMVDEIAARLQGRDVTRRNSGIKKGMREG